MEVGHWKFIGQLTVATKCLTEGGYILCMLLNLDP